MKNFQNIKNNGTIGLNIQFNNNLQEFIDIFKKFTTVSKIKYFTIDISSYDINNKNTIKKLFKYIENIKKTNIIKQAILIKIPSNLNIYQKKFISKQCLNINIDGIVITDASIDVNMNTDTNINIDANTNLNNISNTTVSNKDLNKVTSTIVSDIYLLTKKKVPIIIFSNIYNGQDIIEKIEAGASAIVFNNIIYQGPIISHIVRHKLLQVARERNLSNISQIVGNNALYHTSLSKK